MIVIIGVAMSWQSPYIGIGSKQTGRFFAEFTLSEILPLHFVQGQNDIKRRAQDGKK